MVKMVNSYIMHILSQLKKLGKRAENWPSLCLEKGYLFKYILSLFSEKTTFCSTSRICQQFFQNQEEIPFMIMLVS